MKLTVNKYLNARIASASTQAACQFYRSPGDTITVDQLIAGEELDGNSVWYHSSDDGCYYWSGGIAETEFEIPGQDYYQLLSDEQLMTILGEAKNYFWNLFIKTMPELTGMFVGDKTTGNEITLENYSLVFQVKQKTADNSNPLPGKLSYKGLAIKTDVVQAGVAQFQQVKPGDIIARESNLNTWGTVSLKVSRQQNDKTLNFLLTNYHVAADDLIGAGKYNYDFSSDNNEQMNMVTAAQNNALGSEDAVGIFFEGLLNAYQDVALILMNRSSDADNTINQNQGIDTTPLNVLGSSKYKNKPVTLYRGNRQPVNSVITSVDSSQLFGYHNNTVINQFYNLIQLDLCSIPGDSGSPVLIENQIIGILIGADDTNSYVIPITRILKFFNLKIS